MGYESDDQIAHRKQRERDIKAAWRTWKRSKAERKVIGSLPPASPAPKAIIVTRNRRTDPTSVGFRYGSPT